MSIILYSPHLERKVDLDQVVQQLGFQRGYPVKNGEELKEVLNELGSADLVFLNRYGVPVSEIITVRGNPEELSEKKYSLPSALTKEIGSYFTPGETHTAGLVSKSFQQELLKDWNHWLRRLRDKTGENFSMEDMKQYSTPFKGYTLLLEKYTEEKVHRELKEASARFFQIWRPFAELIVLDQHGEETGIVDLIDNNPEAQQLYNLYIKELEDLIAPLNLSKQNNLQALYTAIGEGFQNGWFLRTVFVKIIGQVLPARILGPLVLLPSAYYNLLFTEGEEEKSVREMNNYVRAWGKDYKIPEGVVSFIESLHPDTLDFNLEDVREEIFHETLSYLDNKKIDQNKTKAIFSIINPPGFIWSRYTENKAVLLFSYGTPGKWKTLEFRYLRGDEPARLALLAERLHKRIPDRIRVLNGKVQYR